MTPFKTPAGRLRFAGVLLFLSLKAWAESPQPPKPLVFVVQTSAEDATAHGNVQMEGERMVQEYGSQFPGARVVLIRANSNAEIRKKLAAYVNQDSAIAGLYVSSHGRMGPNLSPQVSNESRKFLVKLDEPRSVSETFGPLIGKFTSDAHIVFDGCELAQIESQDPKTVLTVMKNVGHNFGLKTGQIYMNRTTGDRGDLLRSQSWADQATASAKASKYFDEAFFWIMTPAYWIRENKFRNQGYTLDLHEERAVLFKDQFFKAYRFKEATGEKETLLIEPRAKSELFWKESSESAPPAPAYQKAPGSQAAPAAR